MTSKQAVTEARLADESPEARVWIAELTTDNVLVGFKQVPLAEAPSGAPCFAEKPDNACDGRYLWSRAHHCFEPRFEWLLKKGETAEHNKRVKALLAGLLPEALATEAEMRTAAFIKLTAPEYAAKLRETFAAPAKTNAE